MLSNCNCRLCRLFGIQLNCIMKSQAMNEIFVVLLCYLSKVTVQ